MLSRWLDSVRSPALRACLYGALATLFVGAALVMMSVAYMAATGDGIRDICTADLIGMTAAQIREALDPREFSMHSDTGGLVIRSEFEITAHRCHVSLDEKGISQAVKIIYHF